MDFHILTIRAVDLAAGLSLLSCELRQGETWPNVGGDSAVPLGFVLRRSDRAVSIPEWKTGTRLGLNPHLQAPAAKLNCELLHHLCQVATFLRTVAAGLGAGGHELVVRGLFALHGALVAADRAALKHGVSERTRPGAQGRARLTALAAVGAELCRLGVFLLATAHEIEAVRGVLPGGAWIVVPGIRRPGEAAGDQARVAGPGEAARGGATHLVIGRPLLQATDPAAAVREFQEAAR